MKIIISIFILISLVNGYDIETIGYGNSKEIALKDAFNNAVSEYVGVVVDAKEVTKNGKLIEDKILTFSNGYIDNYKTISSKEQMGLWEIKIAAVIKQQEVLKEVKKLKIKAKDIKGSEARYAKLISQSQSKFDAEIMFINLIKEYASPNYDKYCTLKIDNIFIDEDSATRALVPITITHSIHFNWYQYSQIIEKFKKLFIGIGGKLIDTKIYNNSSIEKSFYKKKKNIIYIIRKNNFNKFIIELWEFPDAYKVIYPFNAISINKYHDESKLTATILFKYKRLNDVLNPKFIFEDKEGKKLLPDLDFVFMPVYNNRSYQIFNTLVDFKLILQTKLNAYQKLVISPPLDILDNDITYYKNTVDIKISDIKKLKKIGINYEK